MCVCTQYYYATIATMVSHVIAVAVVVYYIIEIRFHNDLIGLAQVHERDPGVALFVSLLLFLCAEIVVNVRTDTCAVCVSKARWISRNTCELAVRVLTTRTLSCVAE